MTRSRFLPLCLAAVLPLAAGCGSDPPEPEPVAKQRDDRGNIAKRKTREILDAEAALARGDFTVAQAKIGTEKPIDAEYEDPLTGPLNIYTEAVGFLGRVPLQQWIDTQQAVEGEYPTYDELIAFVKAEPALSMPVPKVGQHYGYLASEGAMVLLEEIAGGHPAPDVRDQPQPTGVLPVYDDPGQRPADAAPVANPPAERGDSKDAVRDAIRERLGG